MSVPQMPQCVILMSMSVEAKGLGVKAPHLRFPWAALESWPSQPWNLSGEEDEDISGKKSAPQLAQQWLE